MGLCGAKKAPVPAEDVEPGERSGSADSAAAEEELPSECHAAGEPAASEPAASETPEAELPRCDPASEPPLEQTVTEAPSSLERIRSRQSFSSVIRESSLWRTRLVVNNRGSVGDHYSVDKEKLGEGSYGYVRRGVSRETGGVRAVKTLSKAIAKEVRSRFRQEIEIMKEVDHPNIIKLVESFEDKEHIFLVMELCEGGDLYNRLYQEGPLAEAPAAIVMRQIFRSVCYMHGRQICHRDVKPENFLLLTKEPLEQNTLKLTDFGFSCHLEPGRLLSTKLGTPRYSSPQVLAGRYDQSCDLWSCGVIMYVALSGDSPWIGRSDAEVLQSVRRGNYRFAASIWRATSEDAKALIRLLLKYQPEERLTAEQALAHCWIRDNVPEPDGNPALRPSVIADLRDFCKQNRLRQAALQIVAQQLSEEETKAYRQSFAALDTRGKGVLTVADLVSKLEDDDLKLPSIQWAARELSDDDAATAQVAELGYTDFVAASLDIGRHLSQGACRAAFRAFDRNGDGRITQDELEALLKNGSDEIDATTAADVADLLKEADTNHDGIIDFEEFRQMLMGIQLSVD